jgi:hypothetical protein
MKIFRIKRGYTTNSSSANEWLPTSSQLEQREATRTQNIHSISGVVAFVIVMFIGEKVLRRIYERWKKRRDV